MVKHVPLNTAITKSLHQTAHSISQLKQTTNAIHNSRHVSKLSDVTH